MDGLVQYFRETQELIKETAKQTVTNITAQLYRVPTRY